MATAAVVVVADPLVFPRRRSTEPSLDSVAGFNIPTDDKHRGAVGARDVEGEVNVVCGLPAVTWQRVPNTPPCARTEEF